ncbi:MAG: pyridoxal phosphate-dependent aminotransferase [Candidatus Kaelpia aquatica]|nr:pyridoxal phosphate-dependent aminotransferase [Candidatus Kaelpia aquatica]
MDFSKRVKSISASQTLKITSVIKRLKREGEPVINFAAGEPNFDTPDEIKSYAKDSIDGGFTKYTPVAGMPELREEISKKFRAQNNLKYNPDQIVVSNGAKHSLMNVLMALIDVGDEVIIMAPYWLSYTEMVKLSSGVPVIVSSSKESGFRPDFDKLKAAITKKTKCIILNSPTNPTGMVWREDELEHLGKIALEKNILIISDEIYEHLVYEDKHISIGSLSEDIFNNTITINGVSKSHAMTGWRIGWIGANIELVSEVTKMQSQMTSNASSISQRAAIAALRMDDSWLSFIKKEFRERRDVMMQMLDNYGISFIKPEGAFYLFMDISKFQNGSFSFAQDLLDKKLVGVIPGEPFGADDYVRLSYAASIEEIKEGVDRVGSFLDG